MLEDIIDRLLHCVARSITVQNQMKKASPLVYHMEIAEALEKRDGRLAKEYLKKDIGITDYRRGRSQKNFNTEGVCFGYEKSIGRSGGEKGISTAQNNCYHAQYGKVRIYAGICGGIFRSKSVECLWS